MTVSVVCTQSMLRMYDSIESGTLYFNLRSHHNVGALTPILSLLCAQKSQYEFDRVLQSQDHCYLKSLLFVFLNCHHILLLQDTARFNVQWLQIFKFLQELKLRAIAPLIDVMTPTFNHCLSGRDDTTSCDSVMQFLSIHHLSPFTVPVLTFLVPPPNTAGLIALNPLNKAAEYSGGDGIGNMTSSSLQNGTASTLQKAVARKFTNRLQQQIVVLLRRCHAVFPYFETVSTRKESLLRCLETLRSFGFDTASYSDAEIYSTHSRWIETDDMMHSNPLSLFSLLPNRFVQGLSGDIIESLLFLFRAHDSIENDASLLRRRREDSLHRLLQYIEGTHGAIRAHLAGTKPLCAAKEETFSDRVAKKQDARTKMLANAAAATWDDGGGGDRDAGPSGPSGATSSGSSSSASSGSSGSSGGGEHHWRRDRMERSSLPQRIHFYAASKAVYDCLFKSTAEIGQTEPVSLRKAMAQVHGLMHHDVAESDGKMKNVNRGGASELERKYEAMRVGLDTDRLGRYSSLCCRRAMEGGRRVYLRDLVCGFFLNVILGFLSVLI